MAEYPIREASRLSGLPAKTIRYYESIGLIEPAERNASSQHRVYSDADLSRLESLACLRATGMSVPEMRTYLDNRQLGTEGVVAQIQLLEAQEARLAAEAEFLEMRRRFVGIKKQYWESVLEGDEHEIERVGREATRAAKELAEVAKQFR